MDRIGRILMVEDDQNDVELTLAALSEYNLANEVVVTHDGAEALDFLYCRGRFDGRSNGNPAVMLLDLKLPKIDGLEVLRTIRADQRTKLLPVVVLTSSRDATAWGPRLVEAPARGFIPKSRLSGETLAALVG